MICIGADTLTETIIDAYRGLGVLAAGAPSQDGGQGMALAEAGIAVLVERLGHALGRGATPVAEVAGYAITSDAAGVGRMDPEGAGIERAMRLALDNAGLEPGDVVAVWSGRCGLGIADAGEAAAIERVFGSAPGAGGPRILAPRLRLGEPMGAGAPLSIALALAGWRKGDEEHSPHGPILVNSASLGGTNFSIALTPYKEG
jgi:3-oxoacyl-[acyl-carrier-protein] synthase II